MAVNVGRLGLFALFLLVVGCNSDIEGNEPGECQDDADNDADSLFDCADPDCAGASTCMAKREREEREQARKASKYSVPLTDPWKDMSLPIGEGAVLYSDPTAVTISYAGGSVIDLSRTFEPAISAQGWTQTFRSIDGGMLTATYSKGDREMTLAVMEVMGTATVSLMLK